MSFVVKSWQRWLSYIFPIRLETVNSEVSEYLEVQIVRGHIQLCTERAVYSYEKKYNNFRLLFDIIDFNKLKGDEVLILGLGLGSVIQLLEDKKDNLKYTAVELDEEVIRLAEQYIFREMDIDLEIICANGISYVHYTGKKYDLICMDIYIDDWIPEEFVTAEFCESLKNLLTADGLIIFNCPAFNKFNVTSSQKYFDDIFKITFPKGIIKPVHKNYMLLSSPDLLHA